MELFSCVARRLVAEYKKILKRKLGPRERKIEIERLGLQLSCLKEMDDVALYKKVEQVFQELSAFMSDKRCYSGEKAFSAYIEKVLSQYKIYHDKKVIYVDQAVSSALIRLFQFSQLQEKSKSSDRVKSIKQDYDIVVEFGSELQKRQLHAAIKPSIFQKKELFR